MGRVAIAALLGSLLVLPPLPAAAADPPPAPIDISTRIGNDQAQVDAARRLGISRREPVTNGSRLKVLTAYQRICSATTKNNYATGDTCHRSTSLCTTTQTPTWIMTAPATPTPTPNDWTNTGRITCRATSNDNPTPVITANAFRRLPIPPATITIQPDPATGPTLINIGTNFYADHRPRTLNTTVLGQRVRVRATPTTYTWRYGDGATRTTSDPGGPYPTLTTSHIYEKPGTYAVSLTTTFTGEYATPGTPWQPINGTAAVTSPTARITALQARNQLTR